jgi:hypothetical protein
MGARAREHVEQRFGIERVASDHLALYRRVAARD